MRQFITLTITLLITSLLTAQSLQRNNVDAEQLFKDSIVTKPSFLKKEIVPICLAATSLTIMAIPNLKEKIQPNLNWNNQLNNPNYIDLGDDYVRYAPAVAAYALSALGLKSKHRFIDRSVILTVAYITSDFVVHNTKNLTKVARPNNDAFNSFPSQHVAVAFIAASFLDHELGYISPWIPVGGYLAAGYVAYARVARNAHWTSDVLMGAAVGITMTNLSYWAYDKIMSTFPKNLTLTPIIDNQQTGLYVCYRF